jgi:hypothetical protein
MDKTVTMRPPKSGGIVDAAIKWALDQWLSDRAFHLNRKEDVSGIAGTGIVAEGCVFENGAVMLTWLTKHSTVTFYETVEDMEAIHGHDGRTEVIWRNGS